ncbi:amiloride-sensitive sodium channel-related [Holotrichia oblita]|uniref:Amiloride-sensitive sodium channel-related n=1 Tax=Holotrichia oblita TaxID=644536 RepID=A0ACB9SP81_HOLOL|nr:amiloride-sensitive sodium channel-related [Holotrichia oblita]
MALFHWRTSLNSPKQVLKLIAVTICLCIASYQLSECFSKLLRPPISTRYSFNLNDTLDFPAVTICRTPPYKSSFYEKYGLSADGPTKSSSWTNFRFDNYTMKDFFDEATYTFNEVIPFFGFDTLDTNAEVSSFYLLHFGRCFTLTPKNLTTDWDSTGYFLYLAHSDSVKTLNDRGVSISGFHVYIHDRKEVFTGNGDKVDSFLDYLYGETYEDIKLNLKVRVYQQIPTKESYCNDSCDYSLSRCQLKCLQGMITEQIGCSTPWLPNPDLQDCQNYNDTRLLMAAYDTFQRVDYLKKCACPQACNIKIYSHYIHSIKDITRATCEITIKFNSNLVTTMKEVLGYDWNLFLSDLGGSLGFLLGISVLGLVNMFEETVNILLCKRKETKEENTPKSENVGKSDENSNKNGHEQGMRIYFKEKKMFEDDVSKNNTSFDYLDKSKPNNNNHAKYILNKY